MENVLLACKNPLGIFSQGLKQILNDRGCVNVQTIEHKLLWKSISSNTMLLVFICDTGEKEAIIEFFKKLNHSDFSNPVLIICNTIICKTDFQLLKKTKGAKGIISFNTSLDELYKCLDKLFNDNGNWVMSSEIISSLMDSLLTEDIKEAPIYSDIEQQIIELGKQGASIAQMATALQLSKNTIGVYRSRLLKRTGAKSMAKLIFELRS